MIGASVAPPPIPVHPPVMKQEGLSRRPRIFAPKIKIENSQNRPDNNIQKPSENSGGIRPRLPDGSVCKSNPRHRRNANSAWQLRVPGKIPNAPIAPKEAISKFSQFLTQYEISEIVNYPEIFFLGNQSRKNKGLNDFDDKNNNYKLYVGDHLAYRYEIVQILGAGAFGQVAKCIDHKTNQAVAVKVIVNTQLMHEQGKMEVQILHKIGQNRVPYVVRAFDFFVFRNHMCVTFEILGPSLLSMIKNSNRDGYHKKSIKTAAYNIFKALEQIHKLGIIHCDIKPENILQNGNNGFKMIDFGSSCMNGQQRFQYIQSRFYRAPEVILGLGYSFPMDIWSAALVIVELITSKPLFPGRNEIEMISMMTEVMGNPPLSILQVAKRRREFFDDYGRLLPNIANLIRSRESSRIFIGNTLRNALLQYNDQYLYDLLFRCLTWDPTIRISASEALKHPFFSQIDVILPDLH